MTIIETERLILRKFNLNDAEFILELLNTPLWLKFIGDKGVKTIVDAENYLKTDRLKAMKKTVLGFIWSKRNQTNCRLACVVL